MRFSSLDDKFQNISLVELQGDDWLADLRVAGKCISDTFRILKGLIDQKTILTTLELSHVVDDNLSKWGCTTVFKGYKNFPESCCISVNKQLVHGIPTDYRLQEGDVISFDFGAKYGETGSMGDAARTYIFGEPKSPEHPKLIQATQDALMAGIKAIKVGEHLGVIGNAIYKTARNKGYNVITAFGGHGIAKQIHADPFIANRAEKCEGVRIQAGMTLAIEPQCVPGYSSIETRKSQDGWTIYTNEIGAHQESTIYIHSDYVEIITGDYL